VTVTTLPIDAPVEITPEFKATQAQRNAANRAGYQWDETTKGAAPLGVAISLHALEQQFGRDYVWYAAIQAMTEAETPVPLAWIAKTAGVHPATLSYRLGRFGLRLLAPSLRPA
jgi:hypothetical protein